MKFIQFLFGLILAFGAYADGAVTIKSVIAQQRYPWNGLVDIVVTMEGVAADMAKTECLFSASNCTAGVTVPITCVTQNGSDVGSGTTWTRRLIWNATNDVGSVKIHDLVLTVDAKVLGGVQLWEGGPYWAECNLGATKPEESGYYFWWGDTVGYKRNATNSGWISVKDGASFSFSSGNCPTYGKDNSSLQSAAYIDSAGNLLAAYDAATFHLGTPWRMPTDAEFSALVCNCDAQWTTRGGVYGRLVTGRGAYATKSIFLPAAGSGFGSRLDLVGAYGCCWSSSPYSYNSNDAWSLYFYSSNFYRYYDRGGRYCGQSVRPIRGSIHSGKTVLQTGVTTHLELDCRTGVRTCSVDEESLMFDASWHAEGDEVRIIEDGALLTNGVAGVYVWQPTPSCCATRHILKLEVLSSGQIVGTQTAEFECVATLTHSEVETKKAVAPTSGMEGSTAEIRCSRCGEIVQAATKIPALGYIRNVTARQLWPHKKVEVSYTLADDIGEVVEEDDELTVTTLSAAEGTMARARTLIGDTSSTPGLHRVVWDSEADGVQLAKGLSVTVGFGANTVDGLIHRWSFNGNLLDSAGGQTATTVGTAVTAGKTQYTLSGYSNGAGYISLGSNILPNDGSPVTMELWATHNNYRSYSRMLTLMHTLKNSPINGGSDEFSLCWDGDADAICRIASWHFNGVLMNYDCGVEYHISTVFTPLSDGGWQVDFYKKNSSTGETLAHYVKTFTNSQWTLQIQPQTYCMLGHVIGDTGLYDANASYNEFRVWKKAMTETELTESVLAGCDADLSKVRSSAAEINMPTENGPNYYVGYSTIDAGSVLLEMNGLEVLSATNCGEFVWYPGELGEHTITHIAGTNVWTRIVNVESVASGVDEFDKLGYELVGWLGNLEEVGESVYHDNSSRTAPDGSSETQYALWIPNAYTIRFEANGGTGEMQNVSCRYDREASLPTNVFSCVGYLFDGWSRTEAGEVAFQDASIVSNLTAIYNGVVSLYAKWRVCPHEHPIDEITAIEPTSNKSGMMAKVVCQDCGKILQESVEIPALGYIRNVTARQLWPHNKVALEFTVAEDIGEVRRANEDLSVWCARGIVTNVATQIFGDRSAKPGAHRIVWDMDAEGLRFVNAKTTFGVSIEKIDPLVGVQLWENGPYWAEYNVGALKPEEYGYYFCWGDTVGYKRNANNDGWVSVIDGADFSFGSVNCPTSGKDNSELQSAGYIDLMGNLAAAHDAATVHLGTRWRMPTNAEIEALVSNCIATWVTTNGVNGMLVRGRGKYASKRIFLPAAGVGMGFSLELTTDGFYWSSTPSSGFSDNSGYLEFDSGLFRQNYYFNRFYGHSVRPVREFSK